MKKLLFEIGTEELPANYMPNILKDLKELAVKKLQDARVALFSLAPKSLQIVTAAMKLKDTLSFEEKL